MITANYTNQNDKLFVNKQEAQLLM